MVLSYSNDASKIPWLSDAANVTYGVNLKYFMQGFSGSNAAVKDAQGTGFDMDLGVQYKPRKSLTVGISALNILPAGSGGKFTWSNSGVEESIPALIKLGGTAKLFGEDSIYGWGQNVFLGADMDMSPEQDRLTTYHAGVEWWPMSIMALRVGVDQNLFATETSNGVENDFTTGIGLKFNGFTFDYCYHQYSDISDNVTHYFSLGYCGADEEKNTAAVKPAHIPIIVTSASLETFSDVPGDYWARSPIGFMATLGVMNGFQDGTFKPDEPVSRAELATMLIKLKKVDVNDVTSDPYPDVSKDHWAAKYIKAASFLDLMTSYPDGTFKPDKNVSRVEGVVILARFTDATPPKTLTKDPFVDVSRNHWAASQIASAQSYGLLDYLNGKKFDPNKELTRAEVAEMLSKTSYGRDRIRSYLQVGI